jgi:ubiquinone/menaquinone biosynthesis C-methylase UbiE
VALTNPDFRAQSYEIWQRMAAGWDSDRRWMWETTEALGKWLVDALDPQPGQTILELAAGVGETGYLAAVRIGQEGKLISTDFAPNMVEAARAESQRLGLENVEHRQLDAEDMDLPDDSVDGVLCRWGYMLMSDPAGAFSETRRVLREGGAVSFSVFAEPEKNPWASTPGKLLLEVTGGSAPAPTTPGILGMGDPERTRSLLEAGVFEVQRMEELPLTWRFDDFDAYWRFLNELAGALSARIAALTDEERETFRARLEESVEPYRTPRGYEVPAVTQNTLAT